MKYSDVYPGVELVLFTRVFTRVFTDQNGIKRKQNHFDSRNVCYNHVYVSAFDIVHYLELGRSRTNLRVGRGLPLTITTVLLLTIHGTVPYSYSRDDFESNYETNNTVINTVINIRC